MKKQVTIKEQITVTKAIEVDFPVYSKHAVLNDFSYTSTIYYCWKDENTLLHITETEYRGSISYEFSLKTNVTRNASLDYLLGTGEYKSSKNEFMTALRNCKKFLSSFCND